MKIVIDIPNDIYDDIKQVGYIYAVRQAHFVERVETITRAITNGMPIPKDMQQFDERTMAIAFAYAHYMTMLGVNVTEKWDTATEQSANLEQAYRKGYYDATEKMMALNRGNTNESND